MAVFGMMPLGLKSEEPERLEKLRSSFEAAVARATDPLRKTYLDELEKLKNEFTRSAQLEEALAVDREIKKLSGADAGSPAMPTDQKEVVQPKGTDGERAFPRPMPPVNLKKGDEEKARAKVAELAGTTWGNEEVSYLLQPDGVCVRTFADGKVNRGWWELSDNLETVSMRTVDDYHIRFTSKNRGEAYPVGGAKAKGMKSYSVRLVE